MRVLLASSLGGAGHLGPVVSVGQALVRTGHDALVLVPPSLAQAVERTGLPHAVGDEPRRAVIDAIWDRVRSEPREAAQGLIDRDLFAERCARAMLPTARGLCDGWRPNRVVREPCEYASAVAACEAGIAQVQVGISLADVEWGVLGMVAPIIATYRSGLDEVIRSAPYLTAFPASLDPSPWPDTRRYRAPGHVVRPLPDWWPGDDRPLVYVTLGIVTGHLDEAIGVYRTALDAVAALPARVLLTVGRGMAHDELGGVPDNARVEQWVAQGDVFPHAAVVVCHGGSGTTMGALAAGVPLVVCPLFADQPLNGRLIEAAGCGLVVDARHGGSSALRGLTPADVGPLRAAIERVMNDAGYRREAERLAAEMAAAPALDEALDAL